MKVPDKVVFPAATNPMLNTQILRDKLDEVLAYLEGERIPTNGLKPGVTVTANGRYMLEGKFIKSSDAHAD